MDDKAMQERPWIPMLIGFYAFLVIGATPGILNIAWTYMQDTFNVGNDSLGILLGAATIGRLMTAFTSGRVIGQYGVGKFLIGGTILGAVGALGYVVVPSFATLLIAAFVAALGAGVIDAGVNSFASSYFGKGPMNWLHAFFGVGLTIGPHIVTFMVITLSQSWRLSYLVIVILQVVLGLLVFLTLSQWKMPIAADEDEDGRPQSAATMMESLAVPAVLIGMLLFIVYGGVEIGTGQLLNTLFTEGRGISQETSSFWVSFYWGSFTVGRMIVGSIGDRISNNNMMRLSIWGTVLGTFMLWVNVSDMFGFAGLALIGFSLAPMFATLIAETPRRVGKRHTANTIGFLIGSAGIGGALLPGIAGLLAESNGPDVIAPFLFVNTIFLLVLHEMILFREARQIMLAKEAT